MIPTLGSRRSLRRAPANRALFMLDDKLRAAPSRPERHTVLHSWCRAIPMVRADRRRRSRCTALYRRRPQHSRHEQPCRVQQPRPSTSAASSQQFAARRSSCVSSRTLGALNRARLADMLLEKSGFEGGRVFFTLGGADANENAVKIARQASAKPRGKIITRDRSYHGASYAAMALSGDSRTRHQVDPEAFGVVHVPPPYAYRCPFGSANDDAVRRTERRTHRRRDRHSTTRRRRRRVDGAECRHERHRRAAELLAAAARRSRVSAASI